MAHEPTWSYNDFVKDLTRIPLPSPPTPILGYQGGRIAMAREIGELLGDIKLLGKSSLKTGDALQELIDLNTALLQIINNVANRCLKEAHKPYA